MPRVLTIDGQSIADDTGCFVIAEVGHNHQGNLETCMEMMKVAKAVQNRTVDGYVDKIYSQMSSVPREENVRNLGREIHRVYMKQNTKSMS
jgi:sialic acid synthase SpsE